MNSLVEIREILTKALGNPALFSLVNTRIILKTGVDLANIRDDDDKSAEPVAKVLSCLDSMGYSANTLTLVARSKR